MRGCSPSFMLVHALLLLHLVGCARQSGKPLSGKSDRSSSTLAHRQKKLKPSAASGGSGSDSRKVSALRNHTPGDFANMGHTLSTVNYISNKHVNKWYLSLKDVSYLNGKVRIHLPATDNRSFDKLILPHDVIVDRSPLDYSSCVTVESRNVVHSFPCHAVNCYMSNFGHLLINVLNPLFTYAFFVHQNISSLKDATLPPQLLPLSNTLLLLKTSLESVFLASKRPTFLFDLALRFASDTDEFDKYFAFRSKGIHCFRRFSMPIFSHKKRKWQEWDSMHWSIRGRWGRDDFYYNFWREAKLQIFNIYNIISSKPAAEGVNSHTTSSQYQDKPVLLWLARGGKNRKRADMNVGNLVPVFSQYFDFHIVEDSDYKWHLTDQERFNQTRRTLLLLNSADIVVGITGSNMQGALFLKENSMIVDIKTAFNYCNNEAGKTLANHNRMSFYQSKSSYISRATADGIDYDSRKSALFAKEISVKWAIENAKNMSDEPSRKDDWKAECDLMWPDQDPLMIHGSAMLTRSAQSRCYLDDLGENYGWYQLAVRQNHPACELNRTVSYDFGVFCFRQELC